jgi:hypothetical protein
VVDKEGLINYADFANNIDSVFGEAINPTSVIGNSKSTAVSSKPEFFIIRKKSLYILLIH